MNLPLQFPFHEMEKQHQRKAILHDFRFGEILPIAPQNTDGLEIINIGNQWKENVSLSPAHFSDSQLVLYYVCENGLPSKK